MSCCDIGAFEAINEAQRSEHNDAELAALSRKLADGSEQLEFAVPDAHCAACIHSIETGLGHVGAGEQHGPRTAVGQNL